MGEKCSTHDFIDLKKMSDKVPMEILWWLMGKKGISHMYIDIAQDIYEDVYTYIRTFNGVIEDMKIIFSPYQGAYLSTCNGHKWDK